MKFTFSPPLRTVIFASSSLTFTPLETKLLNQSSTTPLDYILGDPTDSLSFLSALSKLLTVVSSGGQTLLVATRVLTLAKEAVAIVAERKGNGDGTAPAIAFYSTQV